MDQTQAIWIKDPLSILADGAERGLVVRGGKIVELVPRGREPVTANAVAYDAGGHVVLPGLINTHHHFYQTLTRARARNSLPVRRRGSPSPSAPPASIRPSIRDPRPGVQRSLPTPAAPPPST